MPKAQTYILETHDSGQYNKRYEIWLYDPEPKYLLCTIVDDFDSAERKVAALDGTKPVLTARRSAELIVKALNFHDDYLRGRNANKTNPPPSKVPPRPSRSRSLR